MRGATSDRSGGALPRTGLRRTIAASLVLLAAASVAFGAAAAQEPSAPAPPRSVVLFIVDLSGSMNQTFDGDRTRLDIAKEAFLAAFSRVPEDAEIGLRVYGDQLPSRPPAARQQNCETDTRLAVPIAPGSRDTILAQIPTLTGRGDTPIALALQAAADDVPEGALATIVLFSDGIDECYDADGNGDPASGPTWGPGDPCDIAREIAAEGIDLSVDRIETVGFNTDEASSTQLLCIAESTGGTFTQIETPEQALDLLPELLTEVGTPRQAIRLGGDPIQGGTGPDDAAELRRIDDGDANARYIDTIAMNEERWYRIPDYGPGAGDTTATVFGLPADEAIDLELRIEPGPDENISSPLVQTRDGVAVPRRPSASVRCAGCSIQSNESHDLFVVVALRHDDEDAAGTFELELLLEGTGWGGPPTSCVEGQRCFVAAQIDAATLRRDELQAQVEGDGSEELAELEARLAAIESDVTATRDQLTQLEADSQTSTSWTIPLVLGVIALAAGGAAFAMRSSGSTAGGATTTADPTSNAAPAGWYDDPDAPGSQRWWDGSTWTDDRPTPEVDAPPEEQSP